LIGETLPLLEVLTRAEGYLAKAGIWTSRLDAEVLLAHVLGATRIQLYAWYDRPLREEEREAYRALVRRRADRAPVAYLTGRREFLSLDFRVTPDVLIPRPETELLVERAVELVNGSAAPRLLDVGTGSGCIAVAWAHEVPDGSFVATDVSAAALGVARGNAESIGVAGRGEFLEGDLFGPVAGRVFGLVVSNPPYVGTGEEVDPECLREPSAAVFAGDDALLFYRRLLPSAAPHLAPGGHLLLELPGSREPEVRAMIPPELEFIETIRDYQRHPRVLVCRRRE
jgi:release factor glutamine methyltransferase